MITGYVRRQALAVSAPVLVADTIDYLTARFVFMTGDWDGLEVWAHFRQGDTAYDFRLDEDGEITADQHLNLTEGVWSVYLTGHLYSGGAMLQRISTQVAEVDVVKSGMVNANPFPPIPASLEEQIFAELEDHEKRLSDVDKQFTEVSSAIVDKVDRSTLQTAVDDALQEAKTSGVFDGSDGKSAYEYAQEGGYTGTETEFAAKLAEEMPDKLPNPNTLTFTGAVTGTYDGSESLTVNIPSGGGGSGWELVSDTTLSEDVSQLEYTGLDCYDLRVAIYGRWNDADDSLSNANINANILLNKPGSGYQYSNGQIGYIRPYGANFHTLIEATAANALYPKVVVSLLPNGDAVSLNTQSSTFESLRTGYSWNNGETAKLNKIIIVPATSGAMLKSGSRIIVMKRS